MKFPLKRGKTTNQVLKFRWVKPELWKRVQNAAEGLDTFLCGTLMWKLLHVPSPQEPIRPLEKRALNFLVNEYLLKNEYKLSSITFSDENDDQVKKVWCCHILLLENLCFYWYFLAFSFKIHVTNNKRSDFKTLTSCACKNNFLPFIWDPGLWVVGWRRSQHPKAPWPVAALPELRDPPLFTQGHGWRGSWGRFGGSSRKLHQPRCVKEAGSLTTGVCMMIEL